MSTLSTAGRPVDKLCIYLLNLSHTCHTAVSIGTNRTYPNTTNLIHESTVANTCNAAIAALAGSMLVVVGGRLEQAAIYAMQPDHLLEK
jgi:hypothetical protein